MERFTILLKIDYKSNIMRYEHILFLHLSKHIYTFCTLPQELTI